MTTLSSIRNAAIEDAGAGGLTVYATKEDLPTSGLTAGDQAYVSANSRLYVSNGSGWYNIALINATPSLSIDPTGTISLSTTGETTTITLTATDSDNAVAGLTYSVESDGSFGGLAVLSQDSSVFTITPLSEDSATTSSAVLTFKASDGINFGSGDRTLTLSFKVENSNYTTLLLKNEETTDNQVDASTNSNSITEVGDVTSAALSPYHPGGYSFHFNDGYYDIAVTDSTDFDFGTGDFTMEGWYYCTNSTTDNYLLSFSTTSGNGHFGVNFYQGSWRVGLFNGSLITGTTGVESNVWHHFAWVRESGVFKFYIDGTQVGSDVSYSSALDCSGTFKIGAYQGSVYGGFWGYLADIRIVKGTAVYTGNFTAPTSRLTAISNTVLLACHLPYLKDGSSSNHTLSLNPNVLINGNQSIKRFGPFDYLGYAKGSHGGSVYVGSAASYLSTNLPAMTGDWTIEGWFQHTANSGTSNNNRLFGHSENVLFIENFTTLRVYVGNVNVISANAANNAMSLNLWYHLALVRETTGNTIKLYINGKLAGSQSGGTYDWPALPVAGIGTDANATAYGMTGLISDFRVVNGTAVYTSNFTPPTAPLTAIANTDLLTCTNKNDIWDASSGNLLTKAGDVAGGGNSGTLLFGQTAIALDGTGDYVAVDRTVGHFGTDDFTVEGWWYFNTVSAGYQAVISLGQDADQRGWIIATETNNGLALYMSNGSAWSYIVGPSTVPTLNAWNHIAAVRNSSTVTLYLNGTSLGTANIGTNSTHSTTSGALYIGHYPFFPGGARSFNGYIQDVRITKGLARYTSNFTPPTVAFDG